LGTGLRKTQWLIPCVVCDDGTAGWLTNDRTMRAMQFSPSSGWGWLAARVSYRLLWEGTECLRWAEGDLQNILLRMYKYIVIRGDKLRLGKFCWILGGAWFSVAARGMEMASRRLLMGNGRPARSVLWDFPSIS